MELHEIVMRLTGETEPIGETRADNERFRNLQTLTELIIDLLDEVNTLAKRCKGSHEYSVNRAGIHAQEFIKDISQEYTQQ